MHDNPLEPCPFGKDQGKEIVEGVQVHVDIVAVRPFFPDSLAQLADVPPHAQFQLGDFPVGPDLA